MTQVTEILREAAVAKPPPGVAALIHPIRTADFVAEYWERRPLIVRREDPAYYSDLLTLADVDRILANSGLRESELRVIDGGENVWPRELSASAGSRAAGDLERVYELYRGGATINLTYLHERWEPLIRLCRRMSVEFSAEAKSNVYLTPPSVQGLKAHHDTHDVFVGQIHGTKRWRLYPSPTELPLHGQRYQHPDSGPGEPVAEFELTPGDMLYLPRGIVHDATSCGAASLHLTIGIIPLRWADVIRSAVTKVTGQNVSFRRSVPTPLTAGDWRSAARTTGAELIAELAASISPDELIAEAGASGPHAFRPVLDGHLLDLETLDGIGPDTTLRRRPDTQFRFTADETSVRLEFHGKAVVLPAHVAGETRHITAADRVTARTLPGGLDEDSRLVLVRKLVDEGFLTVDGKDTDGRPHPA
jgi:hypothetical protein